MKRIRFILLTILSLFILGCSNDKKDNSNYYLISKVEKCSICYGSGYTSVNYCSRCNGSGQMHGTRTSTVKIPCSYCGGFQKVRCNRCDGEGDRYVTCSSCDGDGLLRCPYCHGRGKKITHRGYEICMLCDGTRKIKCNICEGLGSVYKRCCGDGLRNCDYCFGNGYKDTKTVTEDYYKTCEKCNGTGGYSKDECYKCDGTGKIVVEEWVKY